MTGLGFRTLRYPTVSRSSAPGSTQQHTLGQFLAVIRSRELCDARPDPANAHRPQCWGRGAAPQACPRGPASTAQTKATAASQRPAGYRTGDRTATGGCQSPQYVTANKVRRSIPNPNTQLLGSQSPSDRESCSIPACPGRVRHESAILCTLVVTVMRDRGFPVPFRSSRCWPS